MIQLRLIVTDQGPGHARLGLVPSVLRWAPPKTGKAAAQGITAENSGETNIVAEGFVRQELSANLARLWRYGFVLSRERDAADDLVQQTCLRALERAHQFEEGSRFDHWLLSILHSIWLNEVRARKVRQGQGIVDAEQTLSFDGAETVERKMAAQDVLRRVQALPDAQRETVFLAYVEGMSYREVADILAIPVGTVMSRLAAARLKLAEGR